MTAIFADTFFYVALLSRRDKRHRAAHQWSSQWRVQIVTTEFVLLEVANFCRSPRDREKFAAFAKSLETNPLTTLIPCDSAWYQKGLAHFAARLDKEWSLTDCISFVAMEEYGLTDALTDDRHFEQAGFNILL
jgi:predicted nucleic acid-binding protein